MSHAPAPSSRRRRWPYVVAVVVIIVALGVYVASRVQLSTYALTPGKAQSVAPLVSVPANRAHPARGSILLTDVYVTQLSALDYLAYKFNGDAQLVTAAQLLGPGTPPSQLNAQGYLEMAQSQSFAKAAALRHLGYDVPERDAGTLVFGVQPGSPASRALQVGDIVTSVGDTPTPNACSLVAALHDLSPGQRVTFTVQRTTITSDGRIQPGATTPMTVRLAQPHSLAGSPNCPGVSGPPHAYLGVEIETQQDYTFPIPIKINTSQIGGPSAGLAMTLGILEKLDGDLTGGKRVAATGTISPQGAVGDVGGVAQKTVAVERAGATVFFVPPQEYAAAKSKDVPSLHVYAVSSLGQALADLHRLGGNAPTH